MFRAILLCERFEAAWDYLASVRHVDIQGLLRDRALAGWIHETLRTTSLGNAWPRPTGYIATARSQLRIQGYEDTPLCAHRQGGQKSKGRLVQPTKCASKMEAIAWGRPTAYMPGLCQSGTGFLDPLSESWHLFSSCRTATH